MDPSAKPSTSVSISYKKYIKPIKKCLNMYS